MRSQAVTSTSLAMLLYLIVSAQLLMVIKVSALGMPIILTSTALGRSPMKDQQKVFQEKALQTSVEVLMLDSILSSYKML
jgi:acyl CoA:acetate/3-ketoacid CoA transferase alpha subunit